MESWKNFLRKKAKKGPDRGYLYMDLKDSTPHFDAMTAVEKDKARQNYKANLLNEALREHSDKLKAVFAPQLFADSMMLFIGVMRMNHGWGKKRLTRLIHEVNELGDAMVRNHEGLALLEETIEKETRMDIKQVFLDCEEESKREDRAIERAKPIWEEITK